MITPDDLPRRALWRRSTGENQRGDRTYVEAIEIPCRIEKRSRFESGEGTVPYTRIMIGGDTLVEVGDQLSLDDAAEWTNVDDFSDQVAIDGEIVGRILYFESGRL